MPTVAEHSRQLHGAGAAGPPGGPWPARVAVAGGLAGPAPWGGVYSGRRRRAIAGLHGIEPSRETRPGGALRGESPRNSDPGRSIEPTSSLRILF
jgi:hypothetical protein